MRKFSFIAPVGIGVLFLYSGVSKAIFPSDAMLAVMALGASKAVANIGILALAVIEVYLGCILTFRLDVEFGIKLATALLLIFSLFLFYLSLMAHPPKCGCLGLTGAFLSARQSATLGLLQNCVLLWLIWLAGKQNEKPLPTPASAKKEV